MSIINDALKKAQKKAQLSQEKSAQIFSNIDAIRTNVERFVLRRRLIWAGTGVVSLLGIILAVNSFRQPTDVARPQPQPVVAKQTKARSTDFTLSGILYDKQEPLAIINNHIVKEGALINGAQLLEIQPGYVRLSFEEKEFKLEVK